MSESEGVDRDADRWIMTKCTGCGRMMLTMKVGMRRVCKECLEKANKPVELKAEEQRWLEERRRWAEEERQLWAERKVGS